MICINQKKMIGAETVVRSTRCTTYSHMSCTIFFQQKRKIQLALSFSQLASLAQVENTLLKGNNRNAN